MAFVTDQLSLLGLNTREVRVFTALATFGPQKVSKVAARSGMPRTTADYILRSLVKQGIVTREKLKGRHQYRVDLNDVSLRLDALKERLGTPETQVNARSNEKTVTTSDEKIDVATLAKQYAGDRISILLGDVADTGVRLDVLRAYVAAAAGCDVRAELFMSTHTSRLMREYSDLLHETAWMARTSLLVLPRFFLDGIDVFLVRDAAYALRVGDATAEVVRGTHSLEAYKALVISAREAGWPFNPTEHIGAVEHRRIT